VFVELRENKLAFVHGHTSQKSKVCCRAMDYSNRFRLGMGKNYKNQWLTQMTGLISGQ
jgi:hypothetical protein